MLDQGACQQDETLVALGRGSAVPHAPARLERGRIGRDGRRDLVDRRLTARAGRVSVGQPRAGSAGGSAPALELAIGSGNTRRPTTVSERTEHVAKGARLDDPPELGLDVVALSSRALGLRRLGAGGVFEPLGVYGLVAGVLDDVDVGDDAALLQLAELTLEQIVDGAMIRRSGQRFELGQGPLGVAVADVRV